jgi:uncharacterized protein (TIRG00374 family)
LLSLRTTGKLIGLALFTFFLLFYFFSFGDWDLSPLKALSYQLLFFLGFIYIVSLLFHAFAVWLLLNQIHPGSSFFTAYLTLTASLVVGYLLPGRLGIPVRVYLYHRFFNLNVPVSFGLVGWELVVTTLIPLVSSFPVLWIFYSDPWIFSSVVFAFFLLVLLMLTAYFLWYYGVEVRWPSKFRHLLSPLAPFADGLSQTLSCLKPRTLGVFSSLCFLVLLCSVWFSHVLLLHFGAPVSFLTLLSIQSLSYLAGLISLMPMGLGAREISLAVLLGESGVPVDVATYTALIQRVVATGLSFILGLISLQILGLKGVLFDKSRYIGERRSAE